MTLHLSSIEGSSCPWNNPGSFLGRLKDQMFPCRQYCGVLHSPTKSKVNVIRFLIDVIEISVISPKSIPCYV